MKISLNTAPAEPVRAPVRGLRLLIELEPWLPVFLRNLGDLFRPDPPKVWMTAKPGEYWADAQVHRPVAWTRMLQSYLGHTVVVACIYAGNLFWLNQPHVISEDPPQTSTILHYKVSEYLPEVRPQASRTDVPVRQHAQKADPEYSPQRIVTLNVDHTSRRQEIIQPVPKLLRQDVPMPNIVAWTPLPMAPMATRHATPVLPSGAPEVAPPAQPAVERSSSRLTFPVPPQPQVIAPSSPMAANRSATQIIAMAGPTVIPPVEDTARRDASRLTLAAQAPPQVAGPSSEMVARTNFAVLTPVGQMEVVPAPQAVAQHNMAAINASGEAPGVVPPAQPIAGTSRAQTQEAGRLLAFNAHPLPPNAEVSAPEGNRKGEFAAGPEGRAGASGNPETRQGTPSRSDHSATGSGPAGVYVDAPPVKVAGAAIPRLPPPVTLSAGAGSSAAADTPSSDGIDNQIFGGRRRYSMHLNMPNVNSARGSWSVRFAEMNADLADHGDLIAPEAVRKVDPAYPANLMAEQIEGVVVLHAVIRSDGSVDDVRILEGFFEQLDENARKALTQWRFRPGIKNGVPVDVEAVIRVPFRVVKFGF